MRNLLLAILLLALQGGPGWAGEVPFEVHEWGVWVRDTVRVRSLDEKNPEKPDEYPSKGLLAAPTALLSGLPEFVLSHDKNYKSRTEVPQVWRKPVIHFYGRDALEVQIKVLTPQGRPMVYWPKPDLIESYHRTLVDKRRMGATTYDAVGMIWKGKLSATVPANLPESPAKHWWNTVRSVPGAYLNTENGCERFVFYEATALQEPTVTARVEKDAIVIRNSYDKPSGQVLLILNDGKELRWKVVIEIPPKGEVSVTRKDLLAPCQPGASLFDDSERQWLSFGLTKEEAHAIVETWKEDLGTRYGFLLISHMPADLYDKMFPLTVTPKPDKIIRAGAVFDTLVGQDARSEWLPHLKDDLQAWANELRNDEFEVRARAHAKFAQVDNLAKPLLERLVAEKDPETAAAAKLLLKRLEPIIIDQPLGVSGNLTPVERK